DFFAAWLSVFYGYPLFAWIPTHNLNHHKLVNRAGDATITWRYTKRHTFLVAVSYFFVSAYFQSEPIREYVRKARRTASRMYRQVVIPGASVVPAHASLIVLGLALWGPQLALPVYLFALGSPPRFPPPSMLSPHHLQPVTRAPGSP